MASKTKVRLPYHRAPFYFAPEFLATPDQWQASFKKLVSDVLRRERKEASIVTDHVYGLAVVFGRAEFHINALGGTFRVDDAENREHGPLHCASPEKFLRYTLNSENFSQSFWPIVEDAVANFAESLTIEMEARFEEALQAFHAQIEAKLAARTAPFRLIDPQDRRHLRLIYDGFRDKDASEDSDLDDAVYDTGERLYSYGVTLGPRYAPVPDATSVQPEISAGIAQRDNPTGVPKGPLKPEDYLPMIREAMKKHPRKNKNQILFVIQEQLEPRRQKGERVPAKTWLQDQIRECFRNKSAE